MSGTPITFDARLRVRYAETDQMGVVYHSNYIIWFEVGRVELLRHLGFAYRQMEKDHGLHIAVVDVRCRYRAPARYDDEVLVRTRLSNIRDSLLHFKYEVIRAGDGVTLADGETTHLVVNANFQKVPLPEPYSSGLQAAADASGAEKAG